MSIVIVIVSYVDFDKNDTSSWLDDYRNSDSVNFVAILGIRTLCVCMRVCIHNTCESTQYTQFDLYQVLFNTFKQYPLN